jgi:glutamyl-tRNA synthetase
MTAAAATPGRPRVRFCPSPTGAPHVGLVRTALFNWAYARRTGGSLVFRIEDTDPARDSEESYRQLLDAMAWLGLDWDEGVEKGGEYGPYRQSERMDIYRDVAAKLLDGGFAYESFSTPEEVQARQAAAGRDAKEGYDGYDRTLTDAQKQEYRDAGRAPVLRLRMPDQDIVFTDLIRGEITFKAGSIPDYVIVRASGHPLYTLVNPVDDALMKITHVLRGEDLLSSTPRQLALYWALEELGLADFVPQFGHLPYVMGEGNRKLSKRDPSSSLFHLRSRGFIPEGLDNYLALLGWAIGPDRDVFTMAEMVEAFDLARVSPNPARFDLKKAEAINASHIRLLDPADFKGRIVPCLHTAGLVSAPRFEALTPREQAVLTAATPLVQERVTLLAAAPAALDFFFAPDDDVKFDPDVIAGLGSRAAETLATAIAVIEACPAQIPAADLHAALRAALVDGLGLGARAAFAPLRAAISGKRVSPPLFESMEILGRDSTMARLAALKSRLEQAA